MSSSIYRFRSFLKRNFAVILLITLIASSVSAYAFYTEYSKPFYVKKTREVPYFSYEAGFEHWMIVEKENPMWSVGEVLKNRDLYPPVSDTIETAFYIKTQEGVNVSYQVRGDLVIVSGGDEVWRSRLFEKSGSAKGSVREEFEISISDVEKVRSEIEDFLKRGVGAKIEIYANYTLKKGKSISESLKEVITPGILTKVSAESKENTVKDVVVEKVESKKPLTSYLPFAIALVVSIAFGVVAISNYFTFEEDPGVLKEIEFQKVLSKYSKWISRASFSDDLEKSFKVVEITSAFDLVNAAIDNGRRVLYGSGCIIIL